MPKHLPCRGRKRLTASAVDASPSPIVEAESARNSMAMVDLPAVIPPCQQELSGARGDFQPAVARLEELAPPHGQEEQDFPHPAASPAPSWRDIVQVCRPKDWVKNLFVLVPILFTAALYQPLSWAALAVAFTCFCLWSSAVYLLNDTLDAGTDRCHPRKCQRPIAAGRLRPGQALWLAVLLTATAAAVAFYGLPPAFLGLGGLYLANSVMYCLFLKRKVIMDVLLIAIGFVVRILAGCAAIDCPPSSWLVVCSFSLALVLGFGKRRTELAAVEQSAEFRPCLECYDRAKLDVLLGTSSSVCLLSYMLYTIAAETIAAHGTQLLIYTVPFVAYGLFRFIFKVQEGKGDGPTDILLHDRVFLLNGVLWSVAVVGILLIT